MSSGTLKDAVKALNTTFSAPTVPHPLPEELQQTIEAFLEKYQDIDDHDSQRLQEELLSVHNKLVVGSSDKHGPFLSALRLFRPAIRDDARLAEWWTLVVRPTIDAIGHKRDEIEDAREFLLSILVFDAEDDKDGEKAQVSAAFTRRLLDAYLTRTRIPSAEGGAASPEDEFIAHELESVLVAFGRRKPKELLLALDETLTQKEYRAQSLSLLSAFVRVQPPHLYLVLETSLIQHLEKCLMIDTSATVIELALTVLIMFLPHITSALASHLPRLFLIYSRLLCWDKLGIDDASNQEMSEKTFQVESSESPVHSQFGEGSLSWDKLHHTFDNAESTAPSLVHYFTFLYGLFPLNFMSFIRNSRKYLKNIDFPGADDFEFNKEVIRSRSEPFRQVHLLHSNFFTTTIEDELNENRWLKCDPADVVTECMGLCMAVSPTLADPGPPPTSKLPDIPRPETQNEDIPDRLLAQDDADASTIANDALSPTDFKSDSSWRNTHSTTLTTASTLGWQDFPPGPRKTSPVSQYGRRSKSSRAPSPSGKSIKSREAPDSPTLPPRKAEAESIEQAKTQTLETFAQTLSQIQYSGSNPHSDVQGQSLASLQREVMLLRNDLNFERYLKHQHLSHIGQLQRKHIKEATVEAETQNLLNNNRMLKQKLVKANQQYELLKKETLKGRHQSKKWEGELSAKVKSFKEEQKIWHDEEDNLRLELQKAQQDCERLKRLVVESEARELNARQQLRMLEHDMAELESLRQEVEDQQSRIRKYELREMDFDQAEEEREMLHTELEAARMKLNSREAEKERMRRSYDHRIAELESRLLDAQQSSEPSAPGQLSPAAQQVLDSALAASHQKFMQLKKVHKNLFDKYTELEMKFQELEGEARASGGRFDVRSSRAIEDPPAYGWQTANNGSSIGSGSNRGLGSRFPRGHHFASPPRSEDEFIDDLSDYGQRSPSRAHGSFRREFPGRPARFESLQNQSYMAERDRAIERNFAEEYDARLSPTFATANATDPVPPSSYSTHSGDSAASVRSQKTKDKVQPKSEVRIFGRGGAQNIGVKKKDGKKEEKKKEEKVPKTGGFRGLKGIM